jgi:site-specific recombinase XerD
MNEDTSEELADFLRFCRSERRLAPMTCAAYERDVSACLDYLQGQRIEDLAEVKVTHLRTSSPMSRSAVQPSRARRARPRR